MNEVLNLIFSIGATILGGVVCTFLVLCNIHKEEIWNLIYERYF